MPPKNKNAGTQDDTPESMVITVIEDGKTYRLRSDELGPADDLACRQQIGYPSGHFLENFGGDSVLVVLWLARRKQGEPNLPFQKVLEKYPTYKAMEALDFEVETKTRKQTQDEVDPLDD